MLAPGGANRKVEPSAASMFPAVMSHPQICLPFGARNCGRIQAPRRQRAGVALLSRMLVVCLGTE